MLIGILVILNLSGKGIPFQRTAQLLRHVRKDTRRSGSIPLLDIRNRTTTIPRPGKKIPHVPSHRRSNMLFNPLFCLILRIFLQLKNNLSA